MDFSGLGKIKINNGIATFLIITSSLFCPMTLYILKYQRLFFSQDLLKVLVAVGSFGFFEFVVIYLECILYFWLFRLHLPEISNNSKFRRAIITTSTCLIVIYGGLTIYFSWFNNMKIGISAILHTFILADISFLASLLMIAIIENSVKVKVK